MKLLCLVLLVLFQSSAFAGATIVDYYFGNQITGSTLQIDDEGVITHSERICCPPRIEEVSTRNLTGNQLRLLKNWISASRASGHEIVERGSSGYGSSAGQLTVYQNGEAISIRKINFGDFHGGPQRVEFNVAPEAREIESLVFNLVLQSMDL